MSSGAATSGACSTMACTLVPESPYDENRRPPGLMAVGGPWREPLVHQRVWYRSRPSHRAAGLKCRFWGTTPCCRARTALTTPSTRRRMGMPEIGFQRGQRAGALDAHRRCEAGVFDRVTDCGFRAVRLDHCRCSPASDAGGGQRRPVHRRLAVTDGVAMFTVWPSWLGGGARTTPRIRSPSRSARQTFEKHHDAALGGYETVRGDVEGMTPVRWGQHALRRPRDELARIQDHRGATRQGEVAFTVDQAVAGQVHRGQTGRTRGVPPSARDRESPGRTRSARTPSLKLLPVKPYGASTACASAAISW